MTTKPKNTEPGPSGFEIQPSHVLFRAALEEHEAPAVGSASIAFMRTTFMVPAVGMKMELLSAIPITSLLRYSQGMAMISSQFERQAALFGGSLTKEDGADLYKTLKEWMDRFE